MGVLRRLAGLFSLPREERATRPEISWDVLSQSAPAAAGYGGRLAENLSTVLACVNAISSGIAQLPAEVQRRREDGGWETDEDHPLARIISDGANDHQSWSDYIEWLVASALLAGNGLSEVERDGSGAARALRPVIWAGVGVQLLPSGRMAFDVVDTLPFAVSGGRPRRLLEGEVLFLRDRSDDGFIGRSRLQRAAGVVQPAVDLQQFTASMWRNGVNPSGAIETDTKLSEEAMKHLAKQFRDNFAGPQNAAKALLLDQGLKWKSISLSPEDAELLESRRFTVEELARIYGVPPPVIGDLTHGSFTNSETMIRWFAQACLAPWITKLEGEFHRSVFSVADRRTHRLQFDLQGLLRGDPETRWTSHKTAVDAGILTPNEVRGIEGWNPLPGGDKLARAQSNAPAPSQGQNEPPAAKVPAPGAPNPGQEGSAPAEAA